MAGTRAQAGYYMSFAGNMTFKNAQPLRDALAVAPLELVLVETDAPFLTPPRTADGLTRPISFRSRCAMAAVRGIDEETLATALSANTARAFGY